MYTESFIQKIIEFDPTFEVSGDISRLLETIGKAENTLSNQKQIHHFLRNSWSDDRLEIVLAACRIQTWSLKKDDIIACLRNNPPGGISIETMRKIQNYAAILDHLYKQSSPKTFTLQDLKEIHAELRFGIDGKLKDTQGETQLRIGPFAVSKIVDNAEKILYIPPVDKTLNTHIEAFFEWLNYARNKKFNPYIVAAISHHQIMALRPFNQDNGKVARLFMRKLLLSKDYPWRQVLPYERIYAEDRDLYYRLLDEHEVSNRNFLKRTGPRWNQWILYHLVGISDFLQTLIEKYVTYEKYLPPAAPPSLNQRQKKALRYVAKYDEISTRIYLQKFNVGRYQAYMDLQDMVKKGKLLRIGDKGRSVIYILSP